MAKFAALVLALACLCGCGGGTPAAPTSPLESHSGNYETSANISYRELKATAVISQQNPESCLVTFDSPDSIRDLTFLFQRDSVDVSYKGLGFQFDPAAVPDSAVANMAVTAINMAMQDNGVQLSMSEAGMEIVGTMDAGQFILRLDNESGNLLKLSIPSQELEIEFLNFRFLD